MALDDLRYGAFAPLLCVGAALVSWSAGARPLDRGGWPALQPVAEGPVEPVELPTRGPALAAEPEPEPRKGLGLLVGGSVLMGVIGVPGTLASSITLAVLDGRRSHAEASAEFGAIVALIPSLAVLIASVPMTVVGARRYRHWQRWEREQAASRVAWTGGLGLSF